MNTLNKAQTNAYGRYLSGSVMKNSPTVNLKTSNPNRDITMNNNRSRHPIPTVWSNRTDQPRNLVLYDPKSNSSLMNFEETGNNDMMVKIKRDARNKLQTINDDLLPNYAPKINLNPNSLDVVTSETNKNPYFPYLPTSQNNQFPKNAKPTLIDERMLQHTRDRDYAWESDQQEAALNLLNSPKRWERQNRVDDDTRKLLGIGSPVDRWNENKNGYISRPSIPKEYLVEEIKKTEAQKYNNDLDDVNLIHNLEKNSLKHIYSDQLTGMNIKGQNHTQSGNNDIVQSRYVNNYDYNYREPFEEKRKGVLETISSTILKFFKKEDLTVKNERNLNEKFESIPEIPNVDDEKVSIDRIKKDTTYLIRDGNIFVTAPDSLSTYGSTFVSPISRVMCMIENDQLYVIQKLDRERIFGSDLRPVGDDLIVTVLPRNYTEKIRNKLKNSEGRKFVEMKTEDFLHLLEFITNNPSVQHRVGNSTIMNLLKNSEIDELMLKDFSGKNILVQNDALTKIFKATDVDRTFVNIDKDKYKEVENIDDYETTVNIQGKQEPTIRQPLRERNQRFAEIINDRELDPSQLLQTRETGIAKPSKTNTNKRVNTNFGKFNIQ